MVDGKEYPAKLLDAKEARKQYEAIVRKNQDPALLGMGGHGHVQDQRLPGAARGRAEGHARYSQLCRKSTA